MNFRLGVDTGGTYTDAVVVDEHHQVIGTAKALTTHDDLSVAIAESVDAALAQSGVAAAEVGLVALSTTLATNALVEGRTGRIALIRMGLDDEGCRRAGLPAAVGADPIIDLDGGHDSAGHSLGTPDLRRLDELIASTASDVEGFAVAAQFSVRNPAHEQLVQQHLSTTTGRPVTCGHELSSALNGPARAVTCVLNARLIGLIDRLLAAAGTHLVDIGVDAPLMVVRGDGSLMSVSVARQRPVETVLSGPAASVVGAMHLAGHDVGDAAALVSDVGGTTTDVAVVRNGRPELAPDGATVGGHRTMVGAVAVTTVGLGGDSEVAVHPNVGRTRLALGPRRVVPLSLLATTHREAVMAGLAADERMELPSPMTGRFVWRTADASRGADVRERELLDALSETPRTWRSVVVDRRTETVLHRLIARGSVGTAGVTPTDAAHVLGLHDAFDALAAERGLALFARQRDRFGNDIDVDAATLAQRVIDALVAVTGTTLMGVALSTDGYDPSTAEHPFVQSSLGDRSSNGLVRADIGLRAPIIALGASAATYYPAVADAVGGTLVCPPHADVANAIGAVAGRVSVTTEVTVDEPSPDRFRLVGVGEPQTFDDLDAARAAAERLATAQATAVAEERGAADVDVEMSVDSNIVDLGGTDYFVSMTVTAVATGRPTVGLPAR